VKAGLPRALALKMHLLLAAHWLRELPQMPRSWYECNVGLWPPVKARRCLRRQWLRIRSCAFHVRWRITGAILRRVATEELRHAALLLGYDFALGHGREGVLGCLHEFTVGCELGFGVRYGDTGEQEEAVEALLLELGMFRTARPVR